MLVSMSGRPFLQIPGPTNVPERVLRAMDRAVVDHRGPGERVLAFDHGHFSAASAAEERFARVEQHA